ncbi:putative microtubule-associated protein, MAP65/Ase1/PRC1 [Helianthus anomalus]
MCYFRFVEFFNELGRLFVSYVLICSLEKTSGTIEEQLAAIALALEQLWKKKDERIKEISDVQAQIRKICGEIAVSSARNQAVNVDMSDLSLKKLDEFHYQLQELQK